MWRAASLSSTTSTRAWFSAWGMMVRLRWLLPRASHRLKPKVLPWPGMDCTSMLPPIISTSRRVMVRPRPVPPYLRVTEPSAWVKAWNSRATWAWSMPMPLSRTSMRSCTRCGSCCRLRTTTATWPCSVNFTALPIRLVRIWPRRRGSPTRACTTSGATSNSSSRPFAWAFSATTDDTCSSVSSSRNSTASISSLPASILEKSRISLITPSSDCPARWILSR